MEFIGLHLPAGEGNDKVAAVYGIGLLYAKPPALKSSS